LGRLVTSNALRHDASNSPGQPFGAGGIARAYFQKQVKAHAEESLWVGSQIHPTSQDGAAQCGVETATIYCFSIWMTSRPLIGLTTHPPDEQGHYHLAADYVQAVRRAGGIPVLLPPGDGRPEEILARLDGIIFTGGGDVEASLYGADAHEHNYGMNLERDRAEGDLIRAAIAGEKPMLCICRGTQILNVALGGTLHQHLPDVVGEDTLHRAPPREPVPHPVNVEPGTLLAETLGATTCAPDSWHHQAVDKPGHGLTPVARAPDGTIEALAHDSHPWLLAVQWHPELTAAGDASQQAIFDGLVKRASER
jgi:putative glutamine amidotransferase